MVLSARDVRAYNTDKNPTDQSDQTPLHFAAVARHFEVCRIMIGSLEDLNPGHNVTQRFLLYLQILLHVLFGYYLRFQVLRLY